MPLSVTREQSVEMYARFLMVRQGPKASKTAREKADLLAKQGDTDGQKIWNEVADEVDRHKNSRWESDITLA